VPSGLPSAFVLAMSSTLPPGPAGAPARPEALLLEQSRLCLDLPDERGVAACRRALAAGPPSRRAAALRSVLAGKLTMLRRWEEVVEVHREAVRLEPDDPIGHLRLGSALLYLAGRPEEALPSLREAVRLGPSAPKAHGTLGVALAALGEAAAAVAALEEARRLDPDYLEARPASRLVYEAARRGETWP